MTKSTPRRDVGTATARPRRFRPLFLVAWAVLAIGTVASYQAGRVRQAVVTNDAEAQFDSSAASLTSALSTSLARHAAMTAAARTTLALNPELTNAGLRRWMNGVGADQQAGLIGFGFVERVPAGGLDEFRAEVAADPVLTGEADFRVMPPGARDAYCFIRLAATGPAYKPFTLPQGADFCAFPGIGELHTATMDSGEFIMLAFPEGTIETDEAAMARQLGISEEELGKVGGAPFYVIAPVYSGEPVTVEERRAQLTGWVQALFDGRALIHDVLGHRTDVGLTLVRDNMGTAVTVAETSTDFGDRVHTRTDEIDAGGRWTVSLSMSAEEAVANAETQFRAVFAGGMVITLLLTVLLHVLIGARNRALRMVDAKTDELRHQALHDGLTGLPNRVLVLDRAEQMLARARRTGTRGAALFIDLDNFKNVNDTLGHSAGDHLLCAVSDRLQSALREGDTVARLGGDEFVVLAEGASLAAGPELVAQRIMDVLAQPFHLDEMGTMSLPVSASIGIAAGDRSSAEELLRDADLALYEAKAAGKNCYQLFDPRMHAVVQDRLQLEMDLQGAVDRGELHLEYQPTFDLNDGSVTGVEALLRWRHPSRGLIPPNDFIPLAEDNGLIVPIGRWVLQEACRQTAAWHADGKPVAVSVNVSARQLDDGSLVDSVREALEETGLPASALILEITETTLMNDAESTARWLDALKLLGVRIAIDDFGTGYSSLAYLRQFPVDALKIDRSFVASLTHSPQADALIHTLVQLGKTLGLETVAEGIERQTQVLRLQGESCDTGQGFLFARPMAPEAVAAFLETREVRSVAGVGH